jgi:hypothetical protein
VSVAPAVSFTDKSRIFAGPGVAFCTEDRPLRHVYFLGNGEAQVPTINLLRPAAALVELVKHSFLLDIEARDMLVRHFDDLTRLAELPIYFWLDYPRDYEALRRCAKLIVTSRQWEREMQSDHEIVNKVSIPVPSYGPHGGR